MKTLLTHEKIQDSLMLISLAESKQDLKAIEYDVLSIISELQQEASVFGINQNQLKQFNLARQELVELIEQSLVKFTHTRVNPKREQRTNKIVKSSYDKGYKKPKYKNFYESEVE